MKFQEEKIINTLYSFYPVGISEVDDEYRKSVEYKALEKKITDQIMFPFWEQIIQKASTIFPNRIRDLTFLNKHKPAIVNVNHPCCVFSFESDVINDFFYEAIFYISLIDDFYCFSIKKLPANYLEEMEALFENHKNEFNHLNTFERHDTLNEKIREELTIKTKKIWNISLPGMENEIKTLCNLIEENSSAQLFDINHLFEIVPNIDAVQGVGLNKSTFFNCLFGNIVDAK
ncbi:MAG: hypothetical protein ABI091_28915 [Ferruginibacter sp.]